MKPFTGWATAYGNRKRRPLDNPTDITTAKVAVHAGRTASRRYPQLSSLRLRLTLWYVLVLALVMLIFGAFIYSSESRARLYEIDTRLRRQAQTYTLVYKATIGLEGAAAKSSNEEDGLRADQFWFVVGTEHQILYQSEQLGDYDLLHLIVLATLNNLPERTEDYYFSVKPANAEFPDYRIYTTAILRDNARIGTLVIGYPHTDRRTLQSLNTDFAVIAPMLMLLGAGGGYWLANRAMRPVRTITRTAREIEETDLSRRLNLKGTDEIAELAATIDEMFGRLQAAFERQRQFTSDASHELRTPLTIVNLEVSRALSREYTPQEYAQTLAAIQYENQYMTALVNDLLTLARADSGQTQFKQEPLDLSDLALDVVERLAACAHQQAITLSVGNLPELKINGDRLYVLQMLTNLVENAIKYTHNIGHSVQVETGTRWIDQRQWAWVRITDDGPGIAAEHLPRLFERFYRVDRARTSDYTSQSGSGLGLSIVQWVAEIHHGEVTVQSQPGHGTTFEVRLPMIES